MDKSDFFMMLNAKRIFVDKEVNLDSIILDLLNKEKVPHSRKFYCPVDDQLVEKLISSSGKGLTCTKCKGEMASSSGVKTVEPGPSSQCRKVVKMESSQEVVQTAPVVKSGKRREGKAGKGHRKGRGKSKSHTFSCQELGTDTQGDLGDTQVALRDTQGDLRDTQGDLRNTQGDLRNTQGDLRDTQGDLRDTHGDLRDAGKVKKCGNKTSQGKSQQESHQRDEQGTRSHDITQKHSKHSKVDVKERRSHQGKGKNYKGNDSYGIGNGSGSSWQHKSSGHDGGINTSTNSSKWQSERKKCSLQTITDSFSDNASFKRQVNGSLQTYSGPDGECLWKNNVPEHRQTTSCAQMDPVQNTAVCNDNFYDGKTSSHTGSFKTHLMFKKMRYSTQNSRDDCETEFKCPLPCNRNKNPVRTSTVAQYSGREQEQHLASGPLCKQSDGASTEAELDFLNYDLEDASGVKPESELEDILESFIDKTNYSNTVRSKNRDAVGPNDLGTVKVEQGSCSLQPVSNVAGSAREKDTSEDVIKKGGKSDDSKECKSDVTQECWREGQCQAEVKVAVGMPVHIVEQGSRFMCVLFHIL